MELVPSHLLDPGSQPPVLMLPREAPRWPELLGLKGNRSSLSLWVIWGRLTQELESDMDLDRWVNVHPVVAKRVPAKQAEELEGTEQNEPRSVHPRGM